MIKMMKSSSTNILYWDSSAIISALFKDCHSDQALEYANSDGFHFMSTLALAETHGVISRLKRERMLAEVLLDSALESLETGPWRLINLSPDTIFIKALASKWPLRGADLWHLATAKTLQKDLPELTVLTFDNRLYVAALGEKLAV
ncbi:MAG: type II toxin-antitoxin system VapC family toxin [Erysipelothrix sp.]|nr:type II toxin-antitoxin system VapC family toxin [Erysipelothrix sp.]